MVGCSGCSEAKERGALVPNDTDGRSTRPLERLFADLSGPRHKCPLAVRSICYRLSATTRAWVSSTACGRSPTCPRRFSDDFQVFRAVIGESMENPTQAFGVTTVLCARGPRIGNAVHGSLERAESITETWHREETERSIGQESQIMQKKTEVRVSATGREGGSSTIATGTLLLLPTRIGRRVARLIGDDVA